MIQLKIRSLEATEGSSFVAVNLGDMASERTFRIYVGWPEAVAIESHLEGNKLPRPMTHDLIVNILAALQVRILQLQITDIKEDTFYAALTISADGQIHEIDCRPSDGIAMAVRSAAPMYISDELFARIENSDKDENMHSPHPGAIIVDREDTTIH